MASMQSDYRRRSHWRLWVGIFCLVISIVFVSSVWRIFDRNRVARTAAEAVQFERAELLSRKEQLAERVKSLETERGVEEEIRRNFSVAKAGEKVIVVVEPTATETPTTTANWWQKIFDLK